MSDRTVCCLLIGYIVVGAAICCIVGSLYDGWMPVSVYIVGWLCLFFWCMKKNQQKKNRTGHAG